MDSQTTIPATSGAFGEGMQLPKTVKVENVNSQRVVEGLVRSPQSVEILVHN